MIVLDTSVVSELMKPQGSQAVKSWADSQPRESLFTTTITQAEILYGIAILPEGDRKQRLQEAAHVVFNEEFLNQILLFDSGYKHDYKIEPEGAAPEHQSFSDVLLKDQLAQAIDRLNPHTPPEIRAAAQREPF